MVPNLICSICFRPLECIGSGICFVCRQSYVDDFDLGFFEDTNALKGSDCTIKKQKLDNTIKGRSESSKGVSIRKKPVVVDQPTTSTGHSGLGLARLNLSSPVNTNANNLLENAVKRRGVSTKSIIYRKPPILVDQPTTSTGHSGLGLTRLDTSSKNINYVKDIHNKQLKQVQYNCEDCDMNFTDFTCFHLHRRVHAEKKTDECEICGMKFAWNQNLTAHRLTHNLDRPYRCKYVAKLLLILAA